jgi:polyisoprenoid-binding protein YceI
MNKLFALLVLSVGLAACSETGREVETGEAQKVETTTTETTVNYTTVKKGSSMDWRAAHFGGAEPRFGKIFLSKAKISVTDGKVSNAVAVFDMSTFTVENFKDEEQIAKLSGHLQSEDFFNIAKYPISIFELTKLESTEGDFNSSVTGNLTILDSTKSITFMANVNVSESEVSIASEDFAVDRRDWGLVYNVEGSEGVPVEYIVANDIGFTINITLTK